MNPLLKCLAAAALTTQLAAQTNNLPPAMPVSALVAEALSANPEIRFYESEIAAAQAASRLAGRLPSPELGATLGHKRTRDASNQFAGEGTAWSVGVSQTFEWPGRLGLRRALANQDTALARIGLERFRAALSARVRSQALAHAAGAEKRRVTLEVAERLRSLREVLVMRDPAGIAPELEIRILDATELSLRRRASEAGVAVDSARLELLHLLGRPADSTLSVASAEPRLTPPPPLGELLAAAATNNFDLRLRVAELTQQGFRVALTRNERWPAITVGPQFSEENAGGQDRILGIGISVPLPLWRNNAASVDAARARQSQAETLLTVTRRDIERRIATAANACTIRLAEMEKWRPDSIAQFASSAELADRHYRLGAVPAATYVELQKQYLEAVEALLDTRREAVDSIAQLEELTGLNLLAQP